MEILLQSDPALAETANVVLDLIRTHKERTKSASYISLNFVLDTSSFALALYRLLAVLLCYLTDG